MIASVGERSTRNGGRGTAPDCSLVPEPGERFAPGTGGPVAPLAGGGRLGDEPRGPELSEESVEVALAAPGRREQLADADALAGVERGEQVERAFVADGVHERYFGRRTGIGCGRVLDTSGPSAGLAGVVDPDGTIGPGTPVDPGGSPTLVDAIADVGGGEDGGAE